MNSAFDSSPVRRDCRWKAAVGQLFVLIFYDQYAIIRLDKNVNRKKRNWYTMRYGSGYNEKAHH